MTNVALAALALFGLLAVATWAAVGSARKTIEYVAKPGALAALIAVAALLEPSDSTTRSWFLVALVFSLTGDVFLMLPRNLFIFGLGAFLVAHLAYIAGFGPHAQLLYMIVPAIGVGVALVMLAPRILKGAGAVKGPVAAYMAVISAMAILAISTRNPWAALGATAFYISDSSIAWNAFVLKLSWAPVAIMVTYHLAQAGLVLSLI